MKNKYIVGTLALVLLGLGTTQYTLAYMGDATQKGPNYTVEREAQITQAMNSLNYEAWKTLMNNRGRVTDVITKDNFGKFAESWKLAKAGKTTEADAIRKDLGLRTSDQNRVGGCMGGGRGMGRFNK